MGDIPDTLQNLCFGLVDLAGSFHLRSLLFSCLFHKLRGHFTFHFFTFHFRVARFFAWRNGIAENGGILLRVHHLTSVSY